MNFLSLVWPFLILIAIFYFFMYRPQKKLRLERGRFLLSLKRGDHVVTSGGIKVLRDKYVELEIAPKVVIKVEKSAIQHGDVKLIDEESAKKAVADGTVRTVQNPDGSETQIVEEVVEVDDPKDAGTEVIEEVVEEDAKSTEKAPAKEEKK